MSWSAPRLRLREASATLLVRVRNTGGRSARERAKAIARRVTKKDQKRGSAREKRLYMQVAATVRNDGCSAIVWTKIYPNQL
uniref:Uncharacterized protein n=1 Tax=Hyaloperonospora arabidopsidis (strain Emoy2) TaxID=559515 RepID=M4BEU0_HYAAE